MATGKFLRLLILAVSVHIPASFAAAATVYNVQSFGANRDGKSDSTGAFLSAWAATCAVAGPATIYIPPGKYLLRSVNFTGNGCTSRSITIRMDGTLVAPANYNVIGNNGHWIFFESVAGVSIYGGTLDGRGKNLWTCKKSGKTCPKGTTSLVFYESSNITIRGLTSLNSQMFHILVDGCRNVSFVNTRIAAPGSSPNTDGIHVQRSTNVTIVNSHIATGDDCISIGPGSTHLWIENLSCGPGHGVSIGSLGWEREEAGVQNVTVKTATFTGTENGVRVKTWARPTNGFVDGVKFQDSVMVNVDNPIIIDQNYCPNNENCPDQVSGVKINHVRYENIHGTSARQVAIKLNCSKKFPCRGIELDDVNLTYGEKPAFASCAYAVGTTFGEVVPGSCF